MVKLGNSDGAVAVNGFNIHRMAIITTVADGYITEVSEEVIDASDA